MNQASLTYDDNGNLVWDGVLGQMYGYDYLDRLCEVWRPNPGSFMKVLLQTRIYQPLRASSGLGSSTCCPARLRSSALRVPTLAGISGFSRRTFMKDPGSSTGAQLKAKGCFTLGRSGVK